MSNPIDDTITIPRPHVPFGPKGVSETVADAEYLREAARHIEGGYPVGGSHLTATVLQLLRDVASALDPVRTRRSVGPRMHRRFAELRGYMVHNSDVRPTLTEITSRVQDLAQVIGEAVPDGRNKDLALEALEVVHMRAERAFDAPEFAR